MRKYGMVICLAAFITAALAGCSSGGGKSSGQPWGEAPAPTEAAQESTAARIEEKDASDIADLDSAGIDIADAQTVPDAAELAGDLNGTAESGEGGILQIVGGSESESGTAAGVVYQARAVDQNGNPVGGVYVNFCTDTSCQTVMTGENGIAELAVEEPYNYHLQILKVPEGYSFDEAFDVYTGEEAGVTEVPVTKD